MIGTSRKQQPLVYIIAAIGVLAATIFTVNIWLLYQDFVEPTHWFLIFGFELLVLLAALAFLWLWFEKSVVRPLNVLAEDISVIAKINSAHQPSGNNTKHLGELPRVVDDIGQTLLRARNETLQAIHAAVGITETRIAWLETILRSLKEGIIVCNLEHRVALFNNSSIRMLAGAGEFGLRRPVTNVLDAETLHLWLTELQRQQATPPDDKKPHVIEFQCPLAADPKTSFRTKMSLVIQTDPGVVGYVLSLEPMGDPQTSTAEVLHTSIEQTERPEFYDFELFMQSKLQPVLDGQLNQIEYTVFDTETTGLEPSYGDEIIQLAGVRIANGRILREEKFDKLVNPNRHIPSTSTRFHGISDAMVKDHPPAAIVIPDFYGFSQNTVLVAHNAAFDMKFLKLKEAETGISFDHPVLDTLLLSVVLYPNQEDHTLDAIASRFGIDVEGRHTALGDAVATAEIFTKMLPVLADKNIVTLDQAIQASNRIYTIRRQQKRF